MLPRSFILLLVLTLAACAPGPESALNPFTGVERHVSGVHRLQTAPRSAFDARLALVRRDGAERWVILTSTQRRDGDAQRIVGAWTANGRVDYRMLDRRRRACEFIWSGTCAFEEKGEIRLSEAEFEQASAQGGLVLFLQGRRGTYKGMLPATAFDEVLSRAARTEGP